ncbi:MAG TPA: CapA family protein [Chroococcidiopsis sp.]
MTQPVRAERCFKETLLVYLRRGLSIIVAFLCWVTSQASLAQELDLIVGGDVQWAWDMQHSWLDGEIQSYQFSFQSAEAEARYPFQRLASLLREADIAFVNLENPLSDHAPLSRYLITSTFRASSRLATGLKWAGIDVVSTANNHALDVGTQGLLDTIHALSQSGIAAVGTGANLEAARHPFVTTKNGIRLAFLAYTMLENSGAIGFASPNRAGVAPLNFSLIQDDIQQIRRQVDYVILSFHWGVTGSQTPSSTLRQIAHQCIDSGADMIIGGHPHIPQGVEVYRGKVIFYSLGNLIFSYSRNSWGDNYLARLTLTPQQIQNVEILPMAGKNRDITQPFPLTGQRAQKLLSRIQTRTSALDTVMEIDGDRGIVIPSIANNFTGASSPIKKWSILAGMTKMFWSIVAAIVGTIVGVMIGAIVFTMVRRKFFMNKSEEK